MESKSYTYKFNHKKRGRAIIIVNGNFKEYFDDPVWENGRLVKEETGLENRRGAPNEMKLMKKFFQTLGFNIKCYKDVSAKEIKTILKQAAQNEEKKLKQNKEADCFAFIICSHGIQGEPETEAGSNIAYRPHGVAGIDGYFVLTKDIIGYFQDSNCPALRNKPKFFFFQACRSNIYATSRAEKFDIGVRVRIIDGDDGGISVSYDSADNPQNRKAAHFQNIPDAEISDADTDSEDDDPDYNLDSEEVNKSTDMSGVQKVPTGNRNVTDASESFSGGNTDTSAKRPFGDTDKSDTSTSRPDTSALRPDLENFPVPGIAEVATVPCHTDMLLMFASPAGKFAFRSDFIGGWLVEYLYKTLETYGVKHMDFLTFLNMVTHETVQKRAFHPPPPEDENDRDGKVMMLYDGSKVTPFITHRLRGDIYFNDSKLKIRKSILSKIKKLIP